MKKVNVVLLVGIAGLAMAGMTALFLGTLAKGAGRYSTFENARKSGAEVHIQGSWVRRDEISEDPNYFEFFMQDSTGNTSRVRYTDPKPPTMDQATTVLLKGKYEGELFVADKMFLKCPSKYDGEKVPDEMK